MKTKVCTKCKKEKNTSEFHKNKSTTDCFNSLCKDCCKKYRLKNKEIKRKYDKEYGIKNKEKIKKYREKNKEKIAKNKKEWNKNNVEKIKEYLKKNNKYINERHQKNRLKNKDKINRQHKEYRIKNKERDKDKIKEYLLKNSKKIKKYRERQTTELVDSYVKQILKGMGFTGEITPQMIADKRQLILSGRVLKGIKNDITRADQKRKKGNEGITETV